MRAMAVHVLVCGLVFGAGPVAAQTTRDFSKLKVKIGDIIYVTDLNTGTSVNGPIGTLSPSELTINGYRFNPRAALKIERRGDPPWEGAAVGFALGAFALFPILPETFVPRGGAVRINNGLFWGCIGALVDRAHKGRTTIYRSPPN